VLPLRTRELVDRHPIVVPGHNEVDHPRLRPGDGTILAAVLDRDAVDKHPVDRAVALQEGGCVRSGELAVGVLKGFGREIRVQA
jgi:hypothetical protein